MNVFKQDCRAILKISGADALKFINGICTKDIFHLAAEKASANVGFLNARGRLLYDAFIHPDVTGAQKYGSFDGNNILVDCEEAIIDDFEMHLKRYKLRSDVEITRVRDVCVIEAQMESSFSDRSPLRITDKTLDKRFPTTLNMHRTLINRSEFDFFIENLKTSDKVIDGVCDLHKGSGSFESYPMSAKHHYKMLRMRYGIAEGYEEIDSGHYMPFELNLDRQGAIDFKKGCYLGQELVARTHYKGIVRKRLCPIRFTFAKPMGLDESISLPEFKEDSTLMKNELFQSWIEDFNIDMNIKIGSPLMTEKGSMGKIVAVNGNVGLAVIRLLDEELLNTPDSQEFTSTRFDYRSFAVESEIGQLLIAQRSVVKKPYHKFDAFKTQIKNNNNCSEMGKESRRNRSPLDYLDSRCFDCDPTRWRQTAYKQYSQIVPNGAIYSQEMACYLRRFSPEDGRLLIGFGRGGTPTVMVYRVCYLANASNFEDIFKLAHTIRLGSLNENICKDFCLFTSNDRFMIVATASTCSGLEPSSVSLDSSNWCCKSLNPHSLTDLRILDNVKFYLIDTLQGKCTDCMSFKTDYIMLTNHAGVSIMGNNFSVLSIQHQTIWMFYVSESGTFIPTGRIGYLNDYGISRFSEKQSLITVNSSNLLIKNLTFPDTIVTETKNLNHSDLNFHEKNGSLLRGIKQNIFTYLYKQARSAPRNEQKTRIQQLYLNWNLLESLCVTRFQYLDDGYVLLRLVCPQSLSVRVKASNTDIGIQQSMFFALFSLTESAILAFYRSTSPEIFEMIRNYGDFLKICDRDRRGHDWTATNSTELYSQMLWNRQTRLLTAAKQNSGETYATKRLALYLPYAPQTASESPYVDTALFRFEDYSVSSLDRQKLPSEAPIRFFGRQCNRVLFRLIPGPDPNSQGGLGAQLAESHKQRKFVNWIFHPTLPLAISSQHTIMRSTVYNIHIRKV